jgi:aspartyl aminopeptidase
MNEKSKGEALSELLCRNLKSGWDKMTEDELDLCNTLSESYKKFLSEAKTERLAADYVIKKAEENGFIPFNPYTTPPEAGQKFYYLHRNRAVVLGVMGRRSLLDGTNIIAAHIDSPRLDLKANPLYEDIDLSMLKTHYYGGIKKYQWTAIPLAMHGIIIKADGTSVSVSLGEDENDPVFCVTDLLPHLAAEQMKQKMTEGIKGEALNILFGSIPFKDGEVKNRIKLNTLNMLNEKYGICEEDFISGEIEFVPAGNARDVGIDRSMIGGYGQDDRCCAFAAFDAILNLGVPEKTAICVLADKEEIGSMGNTGMKSRFMQNILADLGDMQGIPLRRILSASTCLSADVNAAADPNYADVNDMRNAAKIGYGPCLTKYTGSRGKSGSSDASAELMGKVRILFNEANITWQTGELGKVDQGGGGTVAQYVADLDVDTVDCGIAVLSMHSPFEVISKADLYMTREGYKAFFEKFD